MNEARPRATLLVAAGVGLPVLLLAGAYGPLLGVDDAVTGAAGRLAAAHPLVPTVARGLTHLGDPLLMYAAALMAVLVLLRLGERRLAVLVLAVRVVSQVLSSVLKAVVDRPRPVFDHPVATANGASFPSGHALGSAAVWSTLALLLLALLPAGRALWLAVGGLVPVLVATTRVLIGVHYLSDVVAGLLLGFGTTVTVALLMWPARARVAP